MVAGLAGVLLFLLWQAVVESSQGTVSGAIDGVVNLSPGLQNQTLYYQIYWCYESSQKIAIQKSSGAPHYPDSTFRGRLQLFPNYTLQISYLQKSDSGTYWVYLEDKAGKEHGESIRLTVHGAEAHGASRGEGGRRAVRSHLDMLRGAQGRDIRVDSTPQAAGAQSGPPVEPLLQPLGRDLYLQSQQPCFLQHRLADLPPALLLGSRALRHLLVCGPEDQGADGSGLPPPSCHGLSMQCCHHHPIADAPSRMRAPDQKRPVVCWCCRCRPGCIGLNRFCHWSLKLPFLQHLWRKDICRSCTEKSHPQPAAPHGSRLYRAFKHCVTPVCALLPVLLAAFGEALCLGFHSWPFDAFLQSEISFCRSGKKKHLTFILFLS
nr:PREDICTED: uncharacterized protein LOC104144155 isoform X2 [Struthio camelus australis]